MKDSPQRPRENVHEELGDFGAFLRGAEEGAVRPIEVIFIFAILVPPSYYALNLFLALLEEFVAFEAAVLTSPFF